MIAIESPFIRRIVTASIWRFLAVGLAATLIDFALFSVLVFQAAFTPALANIVSYSSSLIFNFNANRRWTFKQGADRAIALRQGRRFLLANVGGLLLSTAIVGTLSQLTTELAAKLVSVPIVFVWNYACAKLWVFREAGIPSEKS